MKQLSRLRCRQLVQIVYERTHYKCPSFFSITRQEPMPRPPRMGSDLLSHGHDFATSLPPKAIRHPLETYRPGIGGALRKKVNRAARFSDCADSTLIAA